jgi:hypothetical protein
MMRRPEGINAYELGCNDRLYSGLYLWWGWVLGNTNFLPRPLQTLVRLCGYPVEQLSTIPTKPGSRVCL